MGTCQKGNTVDTIELRHEPYDECDGVPIPHHGKFFGPTVCQECGAKLCACELAYGHDCEA